MYPEQPDNTKQKVLAGAVVLVAVALIVIAATMNQGNSTSSTMSSKTSNTATAATTSPSTDATAPNTTPTTNMSSYKDGTYYATSDYYVPHGYESIKVTLTVKSGVVTDSSIQNSETNRESAAYQHDFDSVYKNQVVGKSISDLQLSYVAGASDTTRGFNDALDKIRSEARA